MPVKLLSVGCAELEKVAGGLRIEKDSDGCVHNVVASSEEYKYISALGYLKGQELTAEDVDQIRLRFSRFDCFRVVNCIKFSPKSLSGMECKSNHARLVVK